MNTIRVLKPGLLTTVQDLGRPGFGPMGVSASGAADPVSLQIGNKLAGNSHGAAALEMTLAGGHFSFSGKTMAAITGANFFPKLRGERVPQHASFVINAGDILEFDSAAAGARCYLCVQGGIDVPQFLGSRSTHLLSGNGGLEGRALRKDDILKIGGATPDLRPKRLSNSLQATLAGNAKIRVTHGPQWQCFSDGAQRMFFRQSYEVSNTADRTGIRLEGIPLAWPSQQDMLTEGVALGAIQIPRDGKPIVLFVEQQTTGGYPKIANVIAADVYRLGQLRPKDEVSFELVDFETARQQLLRLERYLASPELICE